MVNLSALSTFSLDRLARRDSVKNILTAALQAVDPYEALMKKLPLHFPNAREVTHDGRLFIAAFGKASIPMAEAANSFFRGAVTGGLVVTKHAGRGNVGALEVVEAAHPIPDARSVQAAVQMTRLLENIHEDDTVLFLISGGGSSLVTCPVDAVTLEDLQILTDLLLKNGAAIHEINTLRRHIDSVKGGGLLRACRSKHMLAFLLSDVIGNQLKDIASGPTAPDPSTFQDARAILEKYGMQHSAPASLLRYLELGLQGRIPETVKPSDAVTHRIQNILLADNRGAAESAVRQAEREGFDAAHLTSELGGEAAVAGQYLAGELRKALPASRPLCIVAGGETTVRVEGNGLGGRNLEVALGAVQGMDGLASAALVTLATDGEDGPTDAAGAVVTGETLSRSVQRRLEIGRFLKNHDSYHFFEALNDLIRIGPTHTNVNDLNFLFAF